MSNRHSNQMCLRKQKQKFCGWHSTKYQDFLDTGAEIGTQALSLSLSLARSSLPLSHFIHTHARTCTNALTFALLTVMFPLPISWSCFSRLISLLYIMTSIENFCFPVMPKASLTNFDELNLKYLLVPESVEMPRRKEYHLALSGSHSHPWNQRVFGSS